MCLSCCPDHAQLRLSLLRVLLVFGCFFFFFDFVYCMHLCFLLHSPPTKISPSLFLFCLGSGTVDFGRYEVFVLFFFFSASPFSFCSHRASRISTGKNCKDTRELSQLQKRNLKFDHNKRKKNEKLASIVYPLMLTTRPRGCLLFPFLFSCATSVAILAEPFPVPLVLACVRCDVTPRDVT